MATNFCKKCGTPNPGDASFCPHCGTSLEDAPLTPEPVEQQPAVQEEYQVPPAPEPVEQQPVAQDEYQMPPPPPAPYAHAPATPYTQTTMNPYAQAPAAPAAKSSSSKTGSSSIADWWKARKAWQKILMIVIVVLVIIFIVGQTTGPQVGDYYEIGNDKIPAVAYVLGDEREVLNVETSTVGDVDIITVEYSMPMGQTADLQQYLTTLCSQGGFIMRTEADFSQPRGSSIQAWKNSVDPGHMIIVQIDYDALGYTVMVMRGVGQVPGTQGQSSGGQGQFPGGQDPITSGQDPLTGGQEQLPGGQEQLPPDTSGGNSGGTTPTLNIPSEEPAGSTTLNDMKIETYADGTVSIADGQGVIMPDGSVFINGNYKESNGPIQIPDEGSSISFNGGLVKAIDGNYYIVANGSVLYIDGTGFAAAYDAP